MAILRKRWILSILLLYLLTDCFAAAGPPARPLRPECCMPCNEKSCSVNIHCTWDQGPDPHIPTTYILHWEPTDSAEEEQPTSSNSSSRVIDREHFYYHEELRVWVEAKNQHGSVHSEENVFNISDIIKPPPPAITLRQLEPLEIEWRSICSDLHYSMGNCDVRNRIETNNVWPKHEGGFLHTYTIDSPLPGTVYEFQVRCACSIGLMSNWSTIHRIRSAEKAPLGELNIWTYCGSSPASFDCALSWKKLPLSHARGVIVGYEVRLYYNNGTATLVNVSTAEPRGQLFCSDVQCHLPASLKDVSSVCVSAFNARGATVPSHLIMPTPAKNENEHALDLKMNEENLTVSWDQPLSHTLNEYVVQYKQVGCPPGQGFDWVKVDSSQETVFFKGNFKKYTPYQVSLFSLSHDKNVRHLSSVIGYSLEGTPSSVPLFKVSSIAATQVTLFWECVPLSMQNGQIQYYQLGTDEQNVYNVSASSQCENGTFELKHLHPGQEYKVWIRAVTGAGSGANTTARFSTRKQHDHYVYVIPTLLASFVLVIICILILLRCFRAKTCQHVASCLCEKVPDPGNSQIFRHMKLQINDPLAWICLPMYEQHPTISVLEVVKNQINLKKTSDVDEITWTAARDGCSYKDCQDKQIQDAVTKERDRTDHRCEREEYSKMVDSDEEGDREEDKDDCSSSSNKEQFTSGYEKHFMPTALELQNV
uniref:interleukin-12 receptor subunit beta-2-like n=1 Tax=Solea senegalensis TaxID=28829 RepID=UPI001CD8845D|nr:interleukin-12 receptor subunit beta-2-like [Solea senegalensis]